MRALLKRVPGLVASVRAVRAAKVRAVRTLLERVLGWASRTPERRAILFDAQRGRYALAEHPRESYLVETADRVIGRILYFRGDFDFTKFERAYALIQRRSPVSTVRSLPVLIDVGANVGSICIPAVARGLVSRALAFEPDRENLRLLLINALLNDVAGRIDADLAAVGNIEGAVSMARSATNFGDHRVRIDDEGDADKVPMIVLDDLADNLDLSNTIVWMDIQGFEGFAVAGAARFCAAGSPLVIEFCKADLDAAGSFELLITTLAESAYSAFYDLGESTPVRQTLTAGALRELGASLDRDGRFTDLLFLAD